MSDFIVIIPARLKSSRLDEKLLQDVAGKPLLYHTYQNACKSDAKKVIIATDSTKIQQLMRTFDIECVLTSEHHISGTSRIKEVVDNLRLAANDLIINVQGDEPLMPYQVINQLGHNLHNSNAVVATICEQFTSKEDYVNPNNVKVVFDTNNLALYFSRAPIPSFRDEQVDLSLCFKHIGIYGYKTSFFELELSSTSYEHAEKLEQLSILQSGYDIHIEQAIQPTGIGVDTIDDLEIVRKKFNDN